MPRDFSSPAEFAAFLTGAVATMETRQAALMTKAALVIETEAKSRIGSYHGAEGPFSAWPQLAESTKQDRVSKGFTPNDPLLRSGGLRDSIGHRSNSREAVIGSNKDEAVWQELGTKKIPPRSFLGSAGAAKADEVVDLIGKGSVEALMGPGARIPISSTLNIED